MTPWIILTILGLVNFAAWWIFRRGRNEERLSQAKIDLQDAKEAARERDNYLRDVDTLTNENKAIHDKIRTLGNGASVDDVVRVLDAAGGKPPTTH